MIRAVVWKELREQGLIALMLAGMGGLLLFAAAMFAEPPVPNASQTDVIATLGVGRLLTLMLVVTAGMVCGGALFASEKESGTMTFLETLPTARWALWRAKMTAGLVLAIVELALLLGIAALLDLAGGAFLLRLIVYALLAFAWGTFGSTLARTTLGSVGIAIPAAILATFIFLIPISLFLSPSGSGMPRMWGWMLFEVLMVVAPLAFSAWRFTALDRRRANDVAVRLTPNRGDVPRVRRGRGWGNRALVWLTLRQLRLTGPVLSAFALGFGLCLLLPEMRPAFVWPALALVAGVLAGVTAFGDEQTHRISLFWSEHRLPIGRAWWVKISLHLVLLVWLLLLASLPCLLRAELWSNHRYGHGHTLLSAIFRTRLFDELDSQGWKYFLLPAVYGFVFGHLCGLFFRKLVVACGVALLLGGTSSVMWGPSLLGGGVRHWQVWLPAVAVLLTGRLLIRSWTGDRMIERGPASRLASGLVTVAILFAIAIGYRIVEVRDNPGGMDDVEFVAKLPPYDENVGGREFRIAAERFVRISVPPEHSGRTTESHMRPRVEERLESAVRYGWPIEDTELGIWLDSVYSSSHSRPDEPSWAETADIAATRPVGVYSHPQLVATPAATIVAVDGARKMSIAILARGLQHQTRDDPAAFATAFHTVMMLARNLRNGGGLLSLEASIEVERTALTAADRWLERLGDGHAKLTLAVARCSAECDDTQPFDLAPYLLAERYVIRGMIQAPNQWLSTNLAPPHGMPEQSAAEADLIALAWAVPWERERTRRLIGRSPISTQPGMHRLLLGRPGSSVLIGRNHSEHELKDRETQLQILRRAMILKATIRTFQSERGRAPASQDEIVTYGYLTHLPEDPYAEGRPFGYRVSTGETLRGASRTAPQGRTSTEPFIVPVGPGRAIIWSVGADGVDEGGRVPPGGPNAPDIVFLVPPATNAN